MRDIDITIKEYTIKEVKAEQAITKIKEVVKKPI